MHPRRWVVVACVGWGLACSGIGDGGHPTQESSEREASPADAPAVDRFTCHERGQYQVVVDRIGDIVRVRPAGKACDESGDALREYRWVSLVGVTEDVVLVRSSVGSGGPVVAHDLATGEERGSWPALWGAAELDGDLLRVEQLRLEIGDCMWAEYRRHLEAHEDDLAGASRAAPRACWARYEAQPPPDVDTSATTGLDESCERLVNADAALWASADIDVQTGKVALTKSVRCYQNP